MQIPSGIQAKYLEPVQPIQENQEHATQPRRRGKWFVLYWLQRQRQADLAGGGGGGGFPPPELEEPEER
jgi:hypothetical protein